MVVTVMNALSGFPTILVVVVSDIAVINRMSARLSKMDYFAITDPSVTVIKAFTVSVPITCISGGVLGVISVASAATAVVIVCHLFFLL
jgi:hypothetical protein